MTQSIKWRGSKSHHYWPHVVGLIHVVVQQHPKLPGFLKGVIQKSIFLKLRRSVIWSVSEWETTGLPPVCCHSGNSSYLKIQDCKIENTVSTNKCSQLWLWVGHWPGRIQVNWKYRIAKSKGAILAWWEGRFYLAFNQLKGSGSQWWGKHQLRIVVEPSDLVVFPFQMKTRIHVLSSQLFKKR